MKLERFYSIRQIMEEAFSNDDLELAKNLAAEYLELADAHKTNWNYGNAIHHGNIILGRIALINGDPVVAKKYLMNAGNTKGSPQLKTFGPNMMLAKELLQLGEKEIVIDYMDLTKKFWWWIVSWRKIRRWKQIIRNGNIPEFGPHLKY